MKVDLFTIGKFTIHGYGFMIGLGILCCVLLGMYRARKRNMSEEAVLDIAIYGVLGGFIGAKLLFVLVEFESFIKNPMMIIASEGFVVYGGIIAGVLAAILYCRHKKLIFLEYFDLLMPSVALAQGFGRIGCLLAGCCYGRPTDSFLGIVFPKGCMAPSGIKLLPTQIFSSIGDFVMAGILICFARKSKKAGNVGILYMFLYSIGRFLIEMFRSDNRGGLGSMSTSQIISIGILALAVLLSVINNRKKPA